MYSSSYKEIKKILNQPFLHLTFSAHTFSNLIFLISALGSLNHVKANLMNATDSNQTTVLSGKENDDRLETLDLGHIFIAIGMLSITLLIGFICGLSIKHLINKHQEEKEALNKTWAQLDTANIDAGFNHLTFRNLPSTDFLERTSPVLDRKSLNF